MGFEVDREEVQLNVYLEQHKIIIVAHSDYILNTR